MSLHCIMARAYTTLCTPQQPGLLRPVTHLGTTRSTNIKTVRIFLIQMVSIFRNRVVCCNRHIFCLLFFFPFENPKWASIIPSTTLCTSSLLYYYCYYCACHATVSWTSTLINHKHSPEEENHGNKGKPMHKVLLSSGPTSGLNTFDICYGW